MRSLFVSLLLVAFGLWTSEGRTVCKDMNDQEVDWFVFYKMPRQKWSDDAHLADGTGFLYLDANNKKWQQQTVGLDSPQQAVAYTMQAYYKDVSASNLFHVLYNDELPDSTVWSGNLGHTKGAAVFDAETGFWLIHSLPRFLNNASYAFPSNAHTYGQMGICVSFTYSALPTLAEQLYHTTPFIYSSHLPLQVTQDVPLLQKVLAGAVADSVTSMKQMTSQGGAQFVHFAKTGSFGKDLYHDFVAPQVASPLLVESWLHESSEDKNLFSDCFGHYSVYNAKYIKLPFDVNFENWYDHSKYAVAYTDGGFANPWVCIGDINRQTHQERRGGGTMCIIDYRLHAAFRGVVTEFYPCN
ncbi:hypothetical protein QR680_012798 [Steinernema hermaphroditum]|uniref:Uncharacterized protein n=1 Tax=Steinernema hermaphroditum TaxID=289476 RepID=A0AA39I397_9BILA|nr:hypothetical protein QR680_012798 [Steinernema hermaphroditum]